MHTPLHKPAFIPNYFSNKSTKTPFWWLFLDNLIEWIFAHDEVLKTSLVEKTGYTENGEKDGDVMEIYFCY